MRNNIITLSIASLCITSLSGLVYADRHHHGGHHRDTGLAINLNTGQPQPIVVQQVPPPVVVTEAVPMPPPGVIVAPGSSAVVVSSQSHHHRFQPQWVNMSAGAPLPHSAVVGGGQPYPPATLFVCRGQYRGGMHPGKFLDGYCNIAWGGKEIRLSRYQVLVSRAPLNWLPASYGQIPPNAVEGGYQHNGPLYVCQANYNGGTHPGKVVGQMCNIAWGGREIAVPYYNVLVR